MINTAQYSPQGKQFINSIKNKYRLFLIALIALILGEVLLSIESVYSADDMDSNCKDIVQRYKFY